MSAFDPKRTGHIKPPRRSPVELCCQLRWASRNIETQVDFRRWPEFVFEIQVHALLRPMPCTLRGDANRVPDGINRSVTQFGFDAPIQTVTLLPFYRG